MRTTKYIMNKYKLNGIILIINPALFIAVYPALFKPILLYCRNYILYSLLYL